jgi:hypothetical protein
MCLAMPIVGLERARTVLTNQSAKASHFGPLWPLSRSSRSVLD